MVLSIAKNPKFIPPFLREKEPKSYFKVQSISKLNIFDLSLVVAVVVEYDVVALLVVTGHIIFSCGQ